MIVVDASVALKWFLVEPGRTEARMLLDSGEALIAPDLLIAEVCNAAWRAARKGRLSVAQVTRIPGVLPHCFDLLAPLGRLADSASRIAVALDHPVYDYFYLALAEREGRRLVTADRRLIARLTGSAWQGRVRDLYG